MQRFREPTEFAPEVTALAGYTFFGTGIVAVIETLYHGGGWQMLRWLQKRHERLIVHDVLHKHAQTFFEGQGFHQVELPFPAEAENRARDMVIMAWPAEGQDEAWVQDQLVASGTAWWVPQYKLRFDDRPRVE